MASSNKKAKKLARQRAARTGERYTVALAAVRLGAEAFVSETHVRNQARWPATIRLVHGDALATLGNLDQVVQIEGFEVKNIGDSIVSFRVDNLNVNRRTTILFDDEVVTLASGATWSRRANGKPVLVPTSVVQLELNTCEHQGTGWGEIEVVFLGSELGPLVEDDAGRPTWPPIPDPGEPPSDQHELVRQIMVEAAVQARIEALVSEHVTDSSSRSAISQLLAQHWSVPRGKAYSGEVAELECGITDLIYQVEEIPEEVKEELLGLMRRHAVLCMGEGRRLRRLAEAQTATEDASVSAKSRLARLAEVTRARHSERWEGAERERLVSDLIRRLEEEVLPVMLSLPVDPQHGYPALFDSTTPSAGLVAWIQSGGLDGFYLFIGRQVHPGIPLSVDSRSVIREKLDQFPPEALAQVDQAVRDLLDPSRDEPSPGG